jgi:hypothetical protein
VTKRYLEEDPDFIWGVPGRLFKWIEILDETWRMTRTKLGKRREGLGQLSGGEREGWMGRLSIWI